MIGFIKKLFSGILSFLVGLFSGKKSEENKPNTPSPAEKLKEATASSAEKLKEATASSAEKLKEATANTNSGMLSSFTGLFGEKKSQGNRKGNGYFMELDEAQEKQSANGNQPAKAEVAKTSEPAAKNTKPEAAKTAKQETAKVQSAVKQLAKVELVQTADKVKAEVKAEPAKPAPAASTNGQKSAENTFAPKYLTPTSSNSRRRPGPSMNSFLNMARQVKTPG